MNTNKKTREGISLQSGENATTLTSKSFPKYKEGELQSKVKNLEKSSQSYFLLLCALIFTTLFSGMNGLASQKFIQSVLHGEPSDLATADLYSNLVTAAAPIFGYLLDNFYPFRLRIGPYLVFASLVASLSHIYVWAFPQSKASYISALSVKACASTFVTVITQGLIVLKTKMDVELFDLKEELEGLKGPPEQRERRLSHVDGAAPQRIVKRDRIGIRLYTIYTIYTSMFEGLSTIFGGFIVDNVPIKLVYLLSASPGIIVTGLIIFYLKEPKEKKWFSESQDLLLTIKSFFKVFFSPLILLPAILKLITSVVPDASDAIRFILINQGGWTYSQLGSVTALAALVVVIVIIKLRNFRQTSSFEFLFLVGTLSTAYTRVTEIPQIFTSIPVPAFIAAFSLQAVFSTFSQLFTTIPLFGRFNTLIPDGFESTGANIMNSLIEISGSLSLYGTKKELEYFGVVNGYYSRVKGPLALNLAISIITCFICPFFLMGRVKSK